MIKNAQIMEPIRFVLSSHHVNGRSIGV